MTTNNTENTAPQSGATNPIEPANNDQQSIGYNNGQVQVGNTQVNLFAKDSIGMPTWWSLGHVILAIALLFTCFMPWFSISVAGFQQSINGLQGMGVIMVLLGLLGGAAGVCNILKVQLPAKKLLPFVLVCTYALMAIMWLLKIIDFYKSVNKAAGIFTPSLGIGFYLTGIIALAGIALSVYGIMSTRKSSAK